MLWAVARVDVTAIGDAEGDELTGGSGGDRIHVRDGEADRVHCGEGRDLVISDQFDQVDANCEVRRQSDITSLDQVDDTEEQDGEPGRGQRRRLSPARRAATFPSGARATGLRALVGSRPCRTT